MARTTENAKPYYDRNAGSWRGWIGRGDQRKKVTLLKVKYDEPPTEIPAEVWSVFNQIKQEWEEKNGVKPTQPTPAQVKPTESRPTIAEYAARWLDMVNAHANENTAKGRRNSVEALLAFVQSHGPVYLEEFTEDDAEAFVRFDRRSHKTSTVKFHLEAIAPMFRHAMKRKVYKEQFNPISEVNKTVKYDKPDPRDLENHYTAEEMALIRERLADYVKTRPRIAWIADYVTVLATSAVRGMAACRLSKSWLKKTPKGRDIIVIPDEPGLKGGGHVYCGKEVKAIIDAAESDLVFPKAKKTQNVASILRTFFKKEGKNNPRFLDFLKRGHLLHKWRHSRAMEWVNVKGVAISTVKEALSHSDIRTTMRYTLPTDDKVIEDLDAMG